MPSCFPSRPSKYLIWQCRHKLHLCSQFRIFKAMRESIQNESIESLSFGNPIIGAVAAWSVE